MKSTNQSMAIALFVRQPIPGRVKTRLARDLGDDHACILYTAMVEDILANIAAAQLPIYLFHDGFHAEGVPVKWIGVARRVLKQQGNTLDERMASAFESLFAAGIEKVLLVGSDIPAMDAALLQAAITALDSNDVVFAPADDGGYCLVAFRKDSYNSGIFCDIPWSTEQVLRTTLDRCTEFKLKAGLLKSLLDVDTLEDLHAYCQNPSPSAKNTNAWLAAGGYFGLPAPTEFR